MNDALDAFIAHGADARFEDLPPHALAAVKTFLLDTLGVGIAGAPAPSTARVRSAAARWGGPGPAHVWGQGSEAMTPASAAFINGFQIHCQEFDCVHEPAVVHPMATILAALMAEAESAGQSVNGRDLAMTLAVAVDMAAGLGIAATSPIRFFRPATAGLFGAVLGVSRLRGFAADETKNAMGYALAFASGTMQAHVEGKPALPVQIAAAARAAIMAADLAEAGMEGPHDVLEGPYGYFALFEEAHDLGPAIAALGQQWRIAEVSHKPFPTGRAAQGGIALIQELRSQGVVAERIERVRLEAPPLIARLVGRPAQAGMSANYARLCFAWCGARALLGGTVGLADFTDTALADAQTLALASRIEVAVNDVTDPAAFTPQVAVAILKDGRQIRVQTDALYGAPADPLSHAAHLEKFRACLAFGFDAPRKAIAESLIDAVDALEEQDDVARLSRLAAGQED